MTATLSNFTPAAGVAAVQTAATQSEPTTPGLRRTRVARARTSVAARGVRKLAGGVTGAWVWRESPPSLREIAAARISSTDRGPDGPVRAVWVVWNFGVAIPATALLYVIAWVLQHPARAALAGLVSAPIVVMWITK